MPSTVRTYVNFATYTGSIMLGVIGGDKEA